MAIDAATASRLERRLQVGQAYGVAAICLAVGLAAGYLLEGSRLFVDSAHPASEAPLGGPTDVVSPVSPNMPQGVAAAAGGQGQPAAHAGGMPPNHAAMAGGHMPTMQQMKAMADKQAEPLLEKLKSSPNDSAILAQVGAIYHSTHQFKEAAAYYAKAVEANPKDATIRTKLAISLYRDGQVDEALAQLNKALKQDPKNADALFNLGMMKLQGKQDGKGAIAAWQQLLKTNPQLGEDRKAEVQKLMAAVLTNLASQQQVQGAASHE